MRNSIRQLFRPAFLLLFFGVSSLSLITGSFAVAAHETHHQKQASFEAGPRGIVQVSWPVENVSRVVSAGYPDSFGLSAFLNRVSPTPVTRQSRQCLRTSFLGLDVDDAFAFDVDEDIHLDILLDNDDGGQLFYSYDANGVAEPIRSLDHAAETGQTQSWYRLTLPRARFANRGMDGTDIAFVAAGAFAVDYIDMPSAFTICDIKISRSNTTQSPQQFGELAVQITGANPALRIGIYDASGRAALPGPMAVPVQFYERSRRQIQFHTFLAADNPQPWPVNNHYFFYIAGKYQDRLPVRKYTLVASKGPEYRMQVTNFTVRAGATTKLDLTLKPWANMPSKGWYTGDVHIHIPRSSAAANKNALAFLAAEGLHVSNLLQLTNPAQSHFGQYAYGDAGRAADGNHTIVPGSEGPRTAHRGHTIALDIETPITDDDQYFLYHTFFEAYRKQGATTGYAHVGSGEFHDEIGLALDVPYDLVDFVEIMQNGSLRTGVWYDFLNMGFRLSAAAGSDFPYFDQPGSVRTLAHINGPFSPDAWFSALKKGHSFATTAPMLEFTVEGQGMGGTVDVTNTPELNVTGRAIINPDFGALDELSVVYCGDVIAAASAADNRLDLNIAAKIAGKVGWVALVARGPGQVAAHSTPVYLTDSAGNSWCPNKAKAQAEKTISQLDAFLDAPIIVNNELEYWELDGLEAQFDAQKPALTKHVSVVKAYYRRMISLLDEALPNSKPPSVSLHQLQRQ